MKAASIKIGPNVHVFHTEPSILVKAGAIQTGNGLENNTQQRSSRFGDLVNYLREKSAKKPEAKIESTEDLQINRPPTAGELPNFDSMQFPIKKETLIGIKKDLARVSAAEAYENNLIKSDGVISVIEPTETISQDSVKHIDTEM